jgi:hypothetical protein
MGIDHLDLRQIHDLRTEEDFRTISGPDGALEAFLEAKANGKTRFIGVTGHHDPAILTRAIREWPVDSVLGGTMGTPMELSVSAFFRVKPKFLLTTSRRVGFKIVKEAENVNRPAVV